MTTTEPRTRCYRGDSLDDEGFPVADVSEHLDDPDTFVWVDLCAPSPQQLQELADELGLHELAVEDALSEHQRPKVDHYPSHIFVAMHAVRLDIERARLDVSEIDTFLGDRWMITVRKDDRFPIDRVVERWDRSSHLARHGPVHLLYGLIDVVVDGYFDVVDSFDRYYDDVSDGLFEDKPLDPARQRDWFYMRRSVVRFHRLVVPMREAVTSLMRRENAAVSAEMYPYMQDVYDHVLRVTESTDALRDLISTIVETNLSLRDYRQNQVMKQVTSWAAIIAVPTLITGFYGMNVPYPGFGVASGWIASLVAIVALSGALYLIFKRRGWL